MADWEQFLTAGVLVAVRLSGLMVFAPVLQLGGDSAAHQGRIRASRMTILLAPAVAAVPGAMAEIDVMSIAGELGAGLVFGL